MKASKGTERMFEIRLRENLKRDATTGGVSGKRSAAKESREQLKARRPSGARKRGGNYEAEGKREGFVPKIRQKSAANRRSMSEM